MLAYIVMPLIASYIKESNTLSAFIIDVASFK
nr:MAG TPA: hypothetical protein [Bacteriophage sp.]